MKKYLLSLLLAGSALAQDMILLPGGQLRFQEATANGINFTTLRGPDSAASNIIWTLPNTTAGATSDGAGGFLLGTGAGGGTASQIISTYVLTLPFLDATTATTNHKWIDIGNTSGRIYLGLEGAAGNNLIAGGVGDAYSGVLVTPGADPLLIGTNNIRRISIAATGEVDVSGDLNVGGVVSGDGANLTNLTAANINGTFNDINMTGDMIREGIQRLVPNPLANDASIEIEMYSNNTVTANSNENFVFPTIPPAEGTFLGLDITPDTVDRTHTIASVYSFSQGAAITSFVQKANQRVSLVFERLASSYVVWGVPLYTTDLPTATPDPDNDFIPFADVSTGLESKALLSTIRGAQLGEITFSVDGGGSVIATGTQTGKVVCPYACTITGVTVLSDVSTTTTFDIWKDAYSAYPPTIADTIVASAKPTLTAAVKSQTSTLTGWTTSVAAGDIFYYSVDTNSAATHLDIILSTTR